MYKRRQTLPVVASLLYIFTNFIYNPEPYKIHVYTQAKIGLDSPDWQKLLFRDFTTNTLNYKQSLLQHRVTHDSRMSNTRERAKIAGCVETH